MGTVDPFGRTAELDEQTLEALVQRFEARGRDAQFARMLDEYREAMALGDEAAVLDMGCGAGLVARAIARRPGFAGTVTGVDLSPYLVAAATRLADGEGVAARTAFRVGDTRALDAADETYDAVVAHTLVSHVDDPRAVIGEAARVLRRGGVLGVFDGDYASLTFDQPDPERARACDQALIDAVVTSPRVMRQMPRLLRAAGLELVTSFAWVLAEVGEADFWRSAIDTHRRLIPQAGTMSVDEAEAWAAALRADSDAGVFFGSCNYYAYVARRP